MKIRKLFYTFAMAAALALCLVVSLTGVTYASSSAEPVSALDTAELFTDRDLEQTADLSDAVIYTVSDGQEIRKPVPVAREIPDEEIEDDFEEETEEVEELAEESMIETEGEDDDEDFEE